jgi:Exostosin family
VQGKKFRSDLVKALLEEKAADMHVQCSVGEIGSPEYNELSHQELMALLFRSVFCPVLPGDDQNSQHLTERYIAGCIPVFIGPPFHTMPFEREARLLMHGAPTTVGMGAVLQRNVHHVQYIRQELPADAWHTRNDLN